MPRWIRFFATPERTGLGATGPVRTGKVSDVLLRAVYDLCKMAPTSANFLCRLGYGEAEKLHPRAPRFDFDDACKII